jgi:hypothetical protein
VARTQRHRPRRRLATRTDEHVARNPDATIPRARGAVRTPTRATARAATQRPPRRPQHLGGSRARHRGHSRRLVAADRDTPRPARSSRAPHRAHRPTPPRAGPRHTKTAVPTHAPPAGSSSTTAARSRPNRTVLAQITALTEAARDIHAAAGQAQRAAELEHTAIAQLSTISTAADGPDATPTAEAHARRSRTRTPHNAARSRHAIAGSRGAALIRRSGGQPRTAASRAPIRSQSVGAAGRHLDRERRRQ